jgi:hypothetical protein
MRSIHEVCDEIFNLFFQNDKFMNNKQDLGQIARSLTTLGETFLKKFSYSAYTFDRIYNDGSCFRLASNPELITYLEENKNMVTAPIPDFLLNKQKFIYVVPDHLADLKPQYAEFKKQFKIGGVIDIIEKKPGYYDQLGFNSFNEYGAIVNTYLNSFEEIQQFYSAFKDKANQLIQTADKEYRYFLESCRLSNLKGFGTENE